jgi:hypothetical protein
MKCVIGWDDDLVDQYLVCESTVSVESIPTQNMFLRKGSTAFTMSRFMVPYMMQYDGWHVFCDSDFYFTDDLRKLLHYADSKYAVSVAKHPNYRPKSKVKMVGQEQTTYKRKNWSSLMLWNCSHPANKVLTPYSLSTEDPLFFHQFRWLDDKHIGSLPLEWNTLEGYYDFNDPKGIHFTDGVPLHDKYSNTKHSDLWLDRYEFLLREGGHPVY